MNGNTLNIVDVKYESDGSSTKVDSYGMREMQKRAYAKRNSQHLLIKAPPASGKSRALMFLALDKLTNQGKKKVIIAALWQKEKCKLLTLPDHPYDVFRLDTGKVNLYGEVRFDKVDLLLIGVKPGEEVLLKIYWDQLKKNVLTDLKLHVIL